MRTIRNSLIFIIIAAIFTNCALQITPVKTQNIETSNEFAVIKTPDSDLAIRYKDWNKNPNNLNSYFTTFFVVFRNNSNKKITLNQNSFYLLDSRGEQFNLYSANEVIDIIFPQKNYFEKNYPIIPQSPNEILDIEEQFQNRDTGIKNIKFDSFSFNQLMPNATKRGYIYFEKIEIEKKTNIELYFNENKITFWIE